jgi:hypothetical protein
LTVSDKPFVVRSSRRRESTPSSKHKAAAAYAQAAAEDVLRDAIKRSLSSHIGYSHIGSFQSLNLDDEAERLIASTCMAVPTPTAAAILVQHLEAHDGDVTGYLQHAARYADAALIGDIVRVGKSKAAADIELQAQVIHSLASGLVQRDGADVRPLAGWAEEVATKMLATHDGDRTPWTAIPIDGLPPSENPWVIAARPSRDGDKDSLFYSSSRRAAVHGHLSQRGICNT